MTDESAQGRAATSSVRFPGESAAYRSARDKLLAAEIELRARIEEVAVQRRALPPGGAVPDDYVFEEAATDPGGTETVRQVKLSELFSKPDASLGHALYATELLYAPSAPGRNGRHVDSIWPLWNLFDFMPDGRGSDWYPQLEYRAPPGSVPVSSLPAR